MVRREDIPWEELQRLNAQGWSYRRLAEKYGVSSSAIGRRAVLEGWHGTNDQRANARLRNLAARLRRQAEQRLAEDLDTREIKELTAVLRELMNLQQTLEGQQPGGGVVRVELAEETDRIVTIRDGSIESDRDNREKARKYIEDYLRRQAAQKEARDESA